MGVHRIVRFLSLMVFVIILGGCAVGITRVKLEHDPLNPVAQKREGTILVKEFKDIRTQEKSYIGNKRNMFGMVLGHIGPEENVRLTKVITRYFIEALQQAGYKAEIVQENKPAGTTGKVDAIIEGEIQNFWLDLYMAVWHYMDVKVVLKSPEDKVLWEGKIHGEEKNVLWVGANAEYEQVVRQSMTKALNQAAQEFASEAFYISITSGKKIPNTP